MSFLERLFCTRISVALGNCESKLNTTVNDIVVLKEQVEKLEADKEATSKRLNELHDDYTANLVLIEDLQDDVAWHENRVKALEEVLASAITIPDVTAILEGESTAIVAPYQNPELGKVINHKMVYDLEAGDLEYLTWNKDVWLSLIDIIRPIVKELHGSPEVPINDCENWAASMSYIAQQAFRKAGLEKQGALFIAWGYKHAYNGFVTPNGKVWIFDPMLVNYMVGELGQPLGDMYDTKDVWFQG